MVHIAHELSINFVHQTNFQLHCYGVTTLGTASIKIYKSYQGVDEEDGEGATKLSRFRQVLGAAQQLLTSSALMVAKSSSGTKRSLSQYTLVLSLSEVVMEGNITVIVEGDLITSLTVGYDIRCTWTTSKCIRRGT